MPNALPFQYVPRVGAVRRLSDTEQSSALEDRDRQVEDFLGRTVASIDANTAAIAANAAAIASAALPHRVYAIHLTAESFTVSGAFTAVPLGGETYDTDGYHSVALNTHRLLVPAGLGGLYQVEARVVLVYGGTVPTRVGIDVRANSSADSNANVAGIFATAGTATGTPLVLNGQLLLNAGTYIEMFVAQAGGTVVTTQGNVSSAQSTSLKMVRICA